MLFQRLFFFSFFLIGLNVVALGQCYKSSLIVRKQETMSQVEGQAYLDYNLNEKYVDLIFQDTVYHYNIKKSDYAKNRKRFAVYFKDSSDNMMWNIVDKQNSFFAFKIRNQSFWFKQVSNCEEKKMLEMKAKASFDFRL